MSQFILDDQLDVRAVLGPRKGRLKARRLAALRPGQRVLDDRVPEILLTLKRPTFLTIDQDFWDRSLCHPGYCILCFALPTDEQEQIPALLRALLRRPEF